MQGPDIFLRESSRRSKPGKQENPEAVELAYRLQTAPPDDIDLLKQLVYQFAGGLYRWVGIQLYYRDMVFPSREEVLSVLVKLFRQAIKQVDQFHGQERVSDWLFGIGYHSIKLPQKNRWSQVYTQAKDQTEYQLELSDSAGSSYGFSFDRLPERIRTPLILRYLFDFGIPEIANILNIQQQEVHRRLVSGRKRLMAEPVTAHQDRQLQSYVDGLLDYDPLARDLLMQHLETCDLCKIFAVKLDAFESKFTQGLEKRWVFPALNDEVMDTLIQLIIDEINQPEKVSRKVKSELRHTGWVLGLVLTFIAMSIVLIRFTAFEPPLLTPNFTPTQDLPPIIEMQPEVASSRYMTTLPGEPEFVEPAFSSDGNWAVFASIKSVPTYWGRSLPTITLYNRESNTTQVLSEGTTPSDKPWIWWDLAPGISGDGRLITYVSSSNDPNSSGDPCQTTDHEPCLDIFIYDRDTRTIKRLTQSVDGGPADGDSLAPTISEDGNVVAFWSTAHNLVDGFENTCQPDRSRVTCLYIFIYDLQTGSVEWIPSPEIPGDPVYGVDRISLSADGRYVGFTATPAAKAGALTSESQSIPNGLESPSVGLVLMPVPEVLHSSEVMVLDRQTGIYELQNKAVDGSPGNGESFSPVLSSDGQYVAFSSFANNIVGGDSNYSSDVFLRNRTTGEVELISVSTAGLPGRGDSGLSIWGKGYFSKNMSADARYVIFESKATNLGQDMNSDCNKIDFSNCNYLYVRDRQTGSTDWISAVPNPDFIFFPDISSDGRWISFMQSFHNCSSTQIQCSNVMLYDRQHSWMTNLTKYEQAVPTLGWSYSDSLVIPWQTWESSALAFSFDGSLVALGGTDSKVRLWRIIDGYQSVEKDAPTKVLGIDTADVFSAVAFSADGQWLAAGTSSGSVYVWNLLEDVLVSTNNNQSKLIRKLVFSQDGTDVIISTLDGSWIWSIYDNRLSGIDGSFAGSSAMTAVDVSASGNILATARSDGIILLQSLPDGKVVGRVSANDHFISNLVFSNDGNLLAVRSSVGAITLWEIDGIRSEAPSIKLLNSFRSYVYDGALAFSSDSKYLASSGIAGGITLYDVPEGNIYSISSSSNIGTVFSLAFSQDGNKLASAFENEVVMWGLHTDRSSNYFAHSLQGRYIDTLPIPSPSASDIPALQTPENGSVDERLSLVQASALLDFPLVIPTHLPANINFISASVNNDGSVLVRYDAYNPELYQATLYIYEKNIGDSPPPTMTIGAGANVLLTQVATDSGSASAEYVQGDWFWRQTYTPPKPGFSHGQAHNVWDWDLTSNSQRLRWQQDGILIALYYQAYPLYSPLMHLVLGSDNITYVSSILSQKDIEQIGSGMAPFVITGSAVTSDIPFDERTVYFWSNGANVSGRSCYRSCRVRPHQN